MLLYMVTQFSSLLAKLGSFCSHAVYVTGDSSIHLGKHKKKTIAGDTSHSSHILYWLHKYLVKMSIYHTIWNHLIQWRTIQTLPMYSRFSALKLSLSKLIAVSHMCLSNSYVYLLKGFIKTDRHADVVLVIVTSGYLKHKKSQFTFREEQTSCHVVIC